MRHIIDDNIRYTNGNKGYTYFEDGDNSHPKGLDSVEKIALELTYQPIAFNSYRLVEIEVLPDGRENVKQEYFLAPDIAYSLFKFFEKIDQESQEDESNSL